MDKAWTQVRSLASAKAAVYSSKMLRGKGSHTTSTVMGRT